MPDGFPSGNQVKRSSFVALPIVGATDDRHLVRGHVGWDAKSTFIRHTDNQPHACALSLHQAIGRQGGGERHKLHLGKQAGIQRGKRVLQPNAQVVLGRQGLRLGDQAAGLEIHDHAVGKSAAGIYADSILHAVCSALLLGKARHLANNRSKSG